jgi:Tol biopolymer transport system component
MSIKFIYKLTLSASIVAFLGLYTESVAQRYPSQETFGKNRVQYKEFKWKIFRTTNFEVYHYQGGTALAKLTAQYAESEFDKITDVLGWTPYSRVKIFLYNSPAEREQSNMGLSTLDNLEDQKLDLSQSRVEVAYTGDQIGFRKKLVKDVSLLFVYDMLYGGNMKEALQSSLLLTLPEWFMSGSAAYISEGWSPEMSDYMRDFFKNRNIRKPTLLTGNDATMIGHSIWNYIAEKYGKDKISDILNLTRIIRNEQTSITSTLGVPSYNRFLRDWRAYYVNQTKNVEKNYIDPQPNWKFKLNELTASEANAVIKVSPDKKWTAVSEIRNGRYRVNLINSETGSKKILRQGKADFIGPHLKTQPPLLGWARNNTLAILAVESDRQNFYLYENLGAKKQRIKLRRNIRGLDQIEDMDISNDGTMLAVSADKAGQNDLFLVSVARSSIMPLTNDLYDDLSPRFVKGSSRRVVFASNRPTDSLGTDKGNFKTISSSLSLFEHDGQPGGDHLTRLTPTAAKVKMSPVYADENDVYYLSNAKGLSNLFKLNRATNTSSQLTNYFFNIRSADVALQSGGAFGYTYLNDGYFTAAYKNTFDPNASVNAPSTETMAPANAGTPAAAAVKTDSAKSATASEPAKLALKDGEVDTDNYQFDEDVLKTFESRKQRGSFPTASSALTRSKATRENIAIKGPFPYKGLFITNDAHSDWRIDPIRGFGYAQSLSMNDLLENHVIKAGLFVSSNFRNSDLFAEYMNNTHRIDFGIRVDRKALYMDAEGSPQKYRFNQVMLTAAYPFSTKSRISVSPIYASTRMIDVYNLAAPDLSSAYGALRAEYVFDNTRVNGLNMMEGTRFKIRYDNFVGISRTGESFNRISLDFRHYQKIHRDLIFAIRASGSHSGGKAPKQNIMGGMENWIGNRKENRTGNNPLNFGSNIDNRDIFFADFATNLRGFNLNRLSGTSYMLLNAELRIPLVKYLYRGAITSSFLRNFQIVGFGDIGTAWTGKGPFSENNSLNTQVIGSENDPFRAIVTNFKNPYLMGYGVGARTTLFGFYVKFDYAWGVDNGYTNKPIPYVTLGYDF